MKKIFIDSDHRGFKKKNELISKFSSQDFEIIDLNPDFDEKDDFNDAAISVSKAVLETPESFGILLCGSAHGISIQANRFRGIRAIIGWNEALSKIAREHNDANIICFSADNQSSDEMLSSLNAFLSANFLAEERFIRRIERLDEDLADV